MSDTDNAKLFVVGILGVRIVDNEYEHIMQSVHYFAHTEKGARDYGELLLEKVAPKSEGYDVHMVALSSIYMDSLEEVSKKLSVDNDPDGLHAYLCAFTAYSTVGLTGSVRHFLDCGMVFAAGQDNAGYSASEEIFKKCPEKDGWRGHRIAISQVYRNGVDQMIEQAKHGSELIMPFAVPDSLQ